VLIFALLLLVSLLIAMAVVRLYRMLSGWQSSRQPWAGHLSAKQGRGEFVKAGATIGDERTKAVKAPWGW
jgi:hypothetical protein